MKILLFLPDFRGGGAERVRLLLAGAFLANGHDVDLVLLREEGVLQEQLPSTVQVIDINADRVRGSLFSLIRYLRGVRPDALLSSMLPLTTLAVLAAKAARFQGLVVVSEHNPLTRSVRSNGVAVAAQRLSMRWVNWRADAVVGVSRGVIAPQAHGARYKGQHIWAHGDAVCWSFYPGNNLGALGDAGAMTTNNSEIAARVRMIGNYGSEQKYVHLERGVNYRLDPLQAAALRVKLSHLDTWTVRRRALATSYSRVLEGTELALPHVPDWAEPVWHLYVVRSHARDALQKQNSEQGVGTLIHYPIPPHMQQAYACLGLSLSALPVARRLANKVFSLSMGPHTPL